MKEEEPILEFEEDFLRGELFSFANIPDAWHEGDHIAELDHSDILDALNETADFVDDVPFEDGMPGMSGTYYTVYATNIASFKERLTNRLLLLLESTSGKAIQFKNAYEQVMHYIRHFGLTGGNLGAGGMGYELEIELSANAPQWAQSSGDHIISQLCMIHNHYAAEFVDVSLRRVGESVHLKSGLRGGCEALPIENYSQFKQELLQLFNCPEEAELAYSDKWDRFCWDGAGWENVFYYDQTKDDYVEVKMGKIRTTKLTRLVKRYVPHNENFRYINELELCLYKDRGAIIVKSAETKWSDITHELLNEKPY